MIPYHGTPLGGRAIDRPAFLRNRHALVSFAHAEDIEIVAEVCRTFVIDNGAFSAWRSGEPITNWKPYYEFVRTWLCHPGFDWAIIPDVIDGDELANDMQIANWLNWREWGKPKTHLNSRSVPVWHMHESLDRLGRLAKGWNRIAIGSSGEFATVGNDKWHRRMHEAFSTICEDGKPICKVHGLRMMDPAIFHRYPFASVDSTNVAQNASRESVRHNVKVGLSREIIAARIESHNSAAIYVAASEQKTLVLD